MPSADTWLWYFRAGVGFILLASLLFMLGFATDHWHDDNTVHYGLWERCEGARCSSHQADDLTVYHVATQGLQSAALGFYALGPVFHFFCYLGKKYKETGWRSRIFDIMYSFGALLHLSSVVLFGLEHPDASHLSWSYRMSAAACPIAIFGIVLVIISRSKALAKFKFRPSGKSSRKSKVGVLVDSQSSTPQSYSGSRSVRHKRASQGSNPGTHAAVNVNINVNTHPASGAAFSTKSSNMPYPAPYGNQGHPSYGNQAHPPYGNQTHPHDGTQGQATNALEQGAYNYASAPPATFGTYEQDLSLTNVKPAPFSSHNNMGDPNFQPQHTFGPSEKQRVLNPSESHALGPIRGSPSGPSQSPSPEFVVPDNHPPSYMDAIGAQEAKSSSEKDEAHTSNV